MSVEDTSIYGNVGIPSDRIELCTKTITDDAIPDEAITEEGEEKVLGVSLDSNLILIILSIIGIIFFWGYCLDY